MKVDHYHQLAEAWLQQRQQGTPASDTTASFATQLIQRRNSLTKDLLMEIERAANEEVNTLWEATIRDEVPSVTTYPKQDLSFLPSNSAPELPFAAIQSAVAEGISYISDQLYGVFALVGRSMQGPAVAVTISRGTTRLRESEEKSVERSFIPDENLLRYELGRREGFAWEMEVTASAETQEHCTVEVSIFDPGKTVADIPITLYDGERTQMQLTNHNGIAVFSKVDRKQLDKLIIHRSLDD